MEILFLTFLNTCLLNKNFNECFRKSYQEIKNNFNVCQVFQSTVVKNLLISNTTLKKFLFISLKYKSLTRAVTGNVR